MAIQHEEKYSRLEGSEKDRVWRQREWNVFSTQNSLERNSTHWQWYKLKHKGTWKGWWGYLLGSNRVFSYRTSKREDQRCRLTPEFSLWRPRVWISPQREWRDSDIFLLCGVTLIKTICWMNLSGTMETGRPF